MNRLFVIAPLAAALACAGNTETADTTGATTQAQTAAAATGSTTGATTGAAGEVSSSGLLDPNSASREQLAAAGVDTAAIGVILAGRPFADMTAVDKALAGRMSAEQRKALYAKVWKPLDLNTAKGEEILLIPGIGNRMKHEFEEYRPYRNIEQFRREIGKYVNKDEVARLEQYVTIRQ
jgi:DNA uptake protein ComE-like DNA-binding protein